VKRTNKNKAFTLIELLVVIAIIALLLSITLPSLQMAKKMAQRTVCGTNLKSIGAGVYAYASYNNDNIPEPFFIYNRPSWPYVWRSYVAYVIDPARPFGQHIESSWGLGNLYDDGIIETPKSFYCPNRTTIAAHSYEAYNSPAWPWVLDDPSAALVTRVGYCYLPQHGSEKETNTYAEEPNKHFPEKAVKTVDLGSHYTLSTDLLATWDKLPHKKGRDQNAGGVNALFGDGSVGFCNNKEAFDEDLWITRPPIESTYSFRKVMNLLRR
jgi:prepilin-type N-terminal cleavage/methylation domain-containing protein/prepilin-type processing-associated H-X9-DG protein